MSITCDAMLGGRLQLRQPASGHRAGSDAVLLAAAVPAQAGERALELGCGVGAAALCLARRVPDLKVTGIEIEAKAVELARQNAALNGLADRVEIVAGDIAAMTAAGLSAADFDHVLLNPPYFAARGGTPSADSRRVLARVAAEGGLELWLRVAVAMLRPGGSVTVIHRMERLGDLLQAMRQRFGGVAIYPLWPGGGKPAKRLILRGRKGSRAALRMLPGLVLHEDGGTYTAGAQAVLRHGGALSLG